MKKSFLIGIPVRDFENPMSRLSEVLSKDQRISLSKSLLLNLVDVFQDENNDIYVVSNNPKVKGFCNDHSINNIDTGENGLNEEIKKFINENRTYKNWTIVHSDLPYLTKHFARVWITLCTSKDIVIAASKDHGTPIFGGSKFFNDFLYGKNSFNKHINKLQKQNTEYERIFHKEFTFELDDAEDYLEFLRHKPRWYKKK
ncbi:hypothetical protein N9M04_00730 [Candidatus Actinomarina sp.]|nr:hypothetical protein [Acidimicrobiaceae bacterium]MDA8719345.1 hypothetical protein [Candidatus Actinomarina sp.]